MNADTLGKEAVVCGTINRRGAEPNWSTTYSVERIGGVGKERVGGATAPRSCWLCGVLDVGADEVLVTHVSLMKKDIR